MMAAGNRIAISTPVNSGTSSNHGLMTKVPCSPSANEAVCDDPTAVWFRLTTRNTTSAMTNDGTVVIIIYRICLNSGTSPTDDANTVVSDSGDILSPK